MALIACPECGKDVSTDATNCPSCGARTKPKGVKWWLWIPLGLVALFFAYGLSIPQYQHDAREMRKACTAMGGSQYDCDRIEADVIRKGKAGGSNKCPPDFPECSWGK
jgi:hypothetical protein